jgi:hypothetical protein
MHISLDERPFVEQFLQAWLRGDGLAECADQLL